MNSQEAVLIHIGLTHQLTAATDATIVELKFHVNHPSLQRQLATVPNLQGEVPPYVRLLLKSLVLEGQHKPIGYKDMVKLKLAELLVLTIRDARGRSVESTDREHAIVRQTVAPTETNTRLTPILKYIEEHLTEDLSLEQLAQRFGYSYTYFCEMFSSALGVSPMRYLRSRRLETAKSLLAATSLPVVDIAISVGFSSSKQLWRTFRQQFGLSPTEYRHRYSMVASVDFLDGWNRTEHYVLEASNDT